jgi:hypothetical protein
MTTDDIAQTGPDQPHAHCTSCGVVFEPSEVQRVMPEIMHSAGLPLVWRCDPCSMADVPWDTWLKMARDGTCLRDVARADEILQRARGLQ